VVAKGGRGGWGNSHFATATRQAPRFAKSGLPGQGMEVQLELKLLADVGLLGFPNVGKSTLISVVSEAKPKIANYHFTTITPTLGVVRMGEGSSFVMADIPGLIEGAGEGVGLGHQFLRHVERCRLLVHILDVSGSEGRDPIEDFEAINKELEVYSPELSTRPQIVAGNKTDMATPEQLARVREYMEEKGYEYFDICAPICEGTKELTNRVAAVLSTLPPILTFEADPVPVEELISSKERFTVTEENGVYTYACPISDTQVLAVQVALDGDSYQILRWQALSSVRWEADDRIPVWSGFTE
jgi:GTP-binding protein